MSSYVKISTAFSFTSAFSIPQSFCSWYHPNHLLCILIFTYKNAYCFIYAFVICIFVYIFETTEFSSLHILVKFSIFTKTYITSKHTDTIWLSWVSFYYCTLLWFITFYHSIHQRMTWRVDISLSQTILEWTSVA